MFVNCDFKSGIIHIVIEINTSFTNKYENIRDKHKDLTDDTRGLRAEEGED